MPRLPQGQRGIQIVKKAKGAMLLRTSPHSGVAIPQTEAEFLRF